MLEHRDREHDVERVLADRLERIGKRPLDRGHAAILLQIRRQCEIDERGMADLVEDGAGEPCVVAAAEVADRLAGEARDVLPKGPPRQPDAEAVDRGQPPVLAVRAAALRHVSA